MKHSFKKLISLVLVLAISFAMAVPAFAETNNEKAVKDSGQKVTYNSDGISTKTVTKVGEATYYYEDSNDYRIW